eukprot:scaffold649_cov347-Pavlova_lutheri.AAC.121
MNWVRFSFPKGPCPVHAILLRGSERDGSIPFVPFSPGLGVGSGEREGIEEGRGRERCTPRTKRTVSDEAMAASTGTPGRRMARLRSVLDANEDHEPLRKAKEREEEAEPIPPLEEASNEPDEREDEAHRKIERLELELREANERIAELQRDVEMLCMQQVDSLSSTVISQRLLELHGELTEAKKLLSQTRVEKEKLQGSAQALEQRSENYLNRWREEKEKNKKLNSDVQYFQTQAAAAMEDRDRTHVQLESATNKINDILKEKESLQRLKWSLEQDNNSMQSSIVALEATLEDTTKALEEERETRQAVERENQRLESELAASIAEKEEAVAGVEENIRASCAQLSSQVAEKDQQITVLQGQLHAVAEAKVRALLSMSEKEEKLRVETETRIDLEAALQEARDQLSQAVEEKVRLLLTNAELQTQLEGGQNGHASGKSLPSTAGGQPMSSSSISQTWSALFYGGKGDVLDEED